MTLLYGPRPMVFVSCRGRAPLVGRVVERDFIVPTSWQTPASQEPAMYCVALSKSYPAALAAIKDEGTFIVNFLGIEHEEAAKALSQHHSEFDEPFRKANLTRENGATLTGCPKIHEALGWAECELRQQIDAGDHLLLIGRIVHSELPRSQAKRLFHVEGDKFTTTE
jgi:3-hydroxy-9,10-secoandrosta-1,3,5(10)-triene-9,17-dione monooxygenase reductase component